MRDEERHLAPRLAPGIYLLEEPVKNVHCDRRQKHDWRMLPEFPAGRYIISRGYIDSRTPDALRLGPAGRYSDVFMRNVYNDAIRKRVFNEGWADLADDLAKEKMTAAVDATVVDVENPSIAEMLRQLKPDASVAGLLVLVDHEQYISREDILLEIVNSGGNIGADIVRGAVARLMAARPQPAEE